MSTADKWRPATEAICREAYRHLVVNNLALYRWLPPLHEFAFFRSKDTSIIYAGTGSWRWVIEVWTHSAAAPPSHAFEVFVRAPDATSILQIAAGQFIAALVPVPLVEELL